MEQQYEKLDEAFQKIFIAQKKGYAWSINMSNEMEEIEVRIGKGYGCNKDLVEAIDEANKKFEDWLL